MPTLRARFDVVVIGAGVAGLWTAARLRAQGWSVALLEARALGSGQTIASQGIIHGGVKYALTGKAGRASAMIAPMPEVWRACLENRPGCEIDLSAAKVLSEHQWIWTAGGVGARLAGAAASKVIRARAERVDADDRPAALRAAPRSVGVHRVPEPVLDPATLVEALSRHVGEHVFLIDESTLEPGIGDGGEAVIEVKDTAGAPVELRASRCVLCAGAGAEAVLARLAGRIEHQTPTMQRRPLHMLLARGDLPDLWAHCVGMSAVPRLTITSQREPDGRAVWYIGGGVAETGVERDEQAQIEAGRAALRDALPWLDTSRLEWSALRIDRAEGRTPDGSRPDEPVVGDAGAFIACWPTKLAFAPAVAREVAARLEHDNVPRRAHEGDALDALQRPGVAPLPWREAGRTWR